MNATQDPASAPEVPRCIVEDAENCECMECRIYSMDGALDEIRELLTELIVLKKREMKASGLVV